MTGWWMKLREGKTCEENEKSRRGERDWLDEGRTRQGKGRERCERDVLAVFKLIQSGRY